MLAGCATLRAPLDASINLLHPHPPVLPLLAPNSLGSSREAVQTLNIEYGDHQQNLQTAVKVNGSVMTLIALGPLGQRAFTLFYDGVKVQSDITPEAAAALPKAFPPDRVLADLELVLWPLPAWQAKLAGTAWKLTEPEPGLRQLRWHGRLVEEVRAEATGDPWNGKRRLTNKAYGYSIAVSSELQ
jgi:hypothetical protein